MNIVKDNTFVFDGVEVKKTGRRAQKTVVLNANAKSAPRTFELVEITPIDDSLGFQWTKWVKESELFIIVK